MPWSDKLNKNFYIKGVKITCCKLEDSANLVIERARSNEPGYVCVTDAGNIVNAYKRSPALKKAINESFVSLPDGRPISILAEIKGIEGIERVAGPDFMEEIFNKTSATGLSHFFLGETVETHRKLKDKIAAEYDLTISGFCSPEFGEWDEETNEKIFEMINASGPDLIWVSLGGGRQETWMAENIIRLRKGVMIGAGAALRFYTGDIKRAPVFFRSIGLEWFFRLLQQPRKMLARYARTLPLFFVYMIQEIFSRENQIQNQTE